MKQSLTGKLPIAKLDAYEATGHQNPARVFSGSNWCESTAQELEERRIFDRGGYLQKQHGVVECAENDEVVISFEEDGRIVPRRLLPENSNCNRPLREGDRVCVHFGCKKKKVFVYVEFAPYKPPGYQLIPDKRS